MRQEIARQALSGTAEIEVSSIPFSVLGDQSRLFLDYLSDPAKLRKYYPNAVASPGEVDSYAGEVLTAYKTDRGRLGHALRAYNERINADERTLQNIQRLSEADTVAVVTGQQAGLFTGPLYTLYKGLSAIKMADALTDRGISAVPVFWIATEDHDFDEVSEVSVIDSDGVMSSSKYFPDGYIQDSLVGSVEIDTNIEKAIDGLLTQLPRTTFSGEIRSVLEECWKEGELFGTAFARQLAALLSRFGMIFIDPLAPGIKELAAPIYEKAIGHADAIVDAVTVRGRSLVEDGYHTQVEVQDDYFPLFWCDDDGVRRAIRKVGQGVYRVKGERVDRDVNGLAELARNEPHRFSPGVMLRPVVQDYLLPTICYFGGGAEIAYFAQNSEVYRVLDRPITPIFHRQSFTVIESKHRKTLEKFELYMADLFDGPERVMLNVSERILSKDTARLFAAVEEEINAQLHRLDQRLATVDPTLAESLGKRRRKIIYHIGALRKKALLAELRHHEEADRRLNALFTALVPNGQLQERTINYLTFANKFGPSFVGQIYRSIDLEDKCHRIVYL